MTTYRSTIGNTTSNQSPEEAAEALVALIRGDTHDFVIYVQEIDVSTFFEPTGPQFAIFVDAASGKAARIVRHPD